MKLSDAIGLEIERREKAMTFEEWIQKWRDAQPDGKLPHELEEGAEEAWDYQQARIEKLDAELAALREAVDEVLNASVSSLEYRSNRLQLAMWGLRAVRDKALLKQEGG